MSVVVRVENISKKYQLGKIGTQSLKGDLQRWWARKRGREDPFGTIGKDLNGPHDVFWALKDVSFDLHQGEAIGIIGKNGAGKSTLLKILSRITLPTTGRLRVKGRIASLLEVGTGFNPDLTGRENIYLNGAILGMTKREVQRKFDEIVDFSGVETFIDTPVKRYSSGMYVRLAFAVAAHLESEILILDEVLAVGDAEFQKKCLGKMDDVAHKQGRTVIFVSHSMASVQKLCQRGVLLNQGRVEMIAAVDRVASHYEKIALSALNQGSWTNRNDNDLAAAAYVKKIEVLDAHNEVRGSFLNTDDVRLRFTVVVKEPSESLAIGFDLHKNDVLAFRSQDIDLREQHRRLPAGEHVLTASIPNGLLNAGEYTITPLVSLYCIRGLSSYEPVLRFNVAWNTGLSGFHKQINDAGYPGAVFPLLQWGYEVKSKVYDEL
ncbi:MAG TPA: polysaccharide ABC transporter ATP-binding protein [Cytophagales bacterium]|jgi:lipopolysaccharide transport system ATP-binding protein